MWLLTLTFDFDIDFNIAIHGDYRNKNHFFDLRIMLDNEELTVVLKDDGKPFDPSTLTEEKNMTQK